MVLVTTSNTTDVSEHVTQTVEKIRNTENPAEKVALCKTFESVGVLLKKGNMFDVANKELDEISCMVIYDMLTEGLEKEKNVAVLKAYGECMYRLVDCNSPVIDKGNAFNAIIQAAEKAQDVGLRDNLYRSAAHMLFLQRDEGQTMDADEWNEVGNTIVRTLNVADPTQEAQANLLHEFRLNMYEKQGNFAEYEPDDETRNIIFEKLALYRDVQLEMLTAESTDIEIKKQSNHCQIIADLTVFL